MSNNRLFFALLVLLIWLPLPLASNRAWAWAILIIGINTLALVWLYSLLRGRASLTPVFVKAKPIFIIWGLWLLLIFVQLIPLPITWLEWLSPQSAFWQSSTLSVDPHATSVALLKSFSYVLLFALILLLTFRNTRLRWLAYALILSGFLQALYGSFMTLSGLEYGFLHEKVYHRGVATGTFINRNHLANYLILCLAVGIGVLIAQLEDRSVSSWRQFFRNLLAWLFSAKIRLRLALVIMVIGLVLTHSRMGNTAFFASLTVAGFIALLLSKQATRATVILLTSLIIIDIFIVGAWFGIDRVVQRLENTTLSHESRDEVSLYTLQYWQDYPFFGSGLGSYYTTFPAYQGEDIRLYYEDAHNDYLQFAAETGSIGLGLLGLALLMTFVLALRTQYRRRNPLCRGIAFSVIMTIIALLIHSTVEFNLQIPANAATFMVILALGWVAAYLPRHNHKGWQPHHFVSKTIVIIAMLGLIYSSYLAAVWGWADVLLKQSQYRIAESRDRQTNFLEAALRLNPGNPEIWEYLGGVLAKTGKIDTEVLAFFQKATELRPVYGISWAHLALLKHRLNQHDAEFFSALKKARRAAPWNTYVQRILMKTRLAAWYHLPQEMRLDLINDLEREIKRQPIGKLIRQSRRQWAVCSFRALPPGLGKFCGLP
ncbi:MAG: O-antigen ligase family protein [Pseudomonadota bacterium]